ncbi:class I tRNA ligase family protein [Patescibacteria group bacterium]|nr:class I tRNA ligase family protein [Patescibacteria group bacterium]
MSKVYDHTKIEEKWQQYWEENKFFLKTQNQEIKNIKDKMYLLFAFAYPSGQGLHVGHVESKTALDILARYYRMNGKNVFFPVGFDAFGLPAENYAIQTGVPPVKTTKNAINTFRRQIKRLGISYDFANELATCHPGYYKWTQWLFLQLYKAGLAYQDTGMVNWCPSCQTVLANEQVVDGVCERCDTQVMQKEMEQWFFKITDYKDELIAGLDQVDWPAPTKAQQLNWIGKKDGAEVDFIVVTQSEMDELKDQDALPTTSVALDHTLDQLEKIIKKWYQKQLVGSAVEVPVLDSKVFFSREIWQHFGVKFRSGSERLFRLLAVPKIYSVLTSPCAVVTAREKKIKNGVIKFWSFEEFVDGAVVKVVVRELEHEKHVYSVIWRGENEDSFESKRAQWQQCHENHKNKHKKKKLSCACDPHPQGINTLQLPFLNSNYTEKLLELSRLLQEMPLKPWLDEELLQRVKNRATARISCFTTRLDTVFGATFVAVSPEKFKQLYLLKRVSEKRRGQVKQYLEQALRKTEEERQIGEKDKTGVDTGLKAVNPASGQAVPVYVADYVLSGYGTGAVMGVPAHDERDFAFAKKHNLEIKQVIAWEGREYDDHVWQTYYSDYGQMVNSGRFNGLDFIESLEQLLEEFAYALRPATIYKLRDWLISRQRYWGAPIPIVYDPEGKPHPVKEEHLPWELPTDVDFKPTGESPLKSSLELKARTEKLYGKGWTPESDTMDTFVDSSWYFLRYVASRDETAFSDPAALQKWLPVDFYMIGPEHIVLHLLYSRFFIKFLRDQGYLDFDEPFLKMRHQGMILGPDGKKMSKSKGNVITPDEVVEKFGADTLRMYEMFMGPIEADKPWDVSAVVGIYRFLSRVYQLVQTWSTASNDLEISTHEALQRKLHQTIKKVSADIPALKFNTAIAMMMELINVWEAAVKEETTKKAVVKETAEEVGSPAVISSTDVLAFIKILAPFAPFMAEELYQEIAENQVAKKQIAENPAQSIHLDVWPEWDEALALEQQVAIPVQINGKVRGEVLVAHDQLEEKEVVLAAAKKVESVQNYLKGKKVVKEIYVPGRIVSLVIRLAAK